MQSSYNDNNI